MKVFLLYLGKLYLLRDLSVLLLLFFRFVLQLFCVNAGFLLDGVDMLRLVMSLIRIFLVSHYDLVLRLQLRLRL